MAAKKKVTKKAPAKKAAKKSAKKAPTKRVLATRAPVKKTAAKKAPTKKTPTKKAPSKKTPARKPSTAKPGKEQPSGAKTPAIGADRAKSVANNVPAVAAAPKKPAKPVKLTVFVRKQRQNLLDLRDQLMDAMYGVQQETLRKAAEGSEASGSGMHQGDAGSDAYDRDFALNLLSKEQDALQEIEAALERISDGIYGVCEMSGKKIPQPRLEAIPFARLTVVCQTRWEKEFPRRQFRGEDAATRAMIEDKGSAVSLDEGDK